MFGTVLQWAKTLCNSAYTLSPIDGDGKVMRSRTASLFLIVDCL